jgi:peptidoglycan/xylan/chitin deacetylase (PgdA/CDA1 family)
LHVVLLLLSAVAGNGLAAQAGEKQVTVVFRFDDFSETSDTEVETRLIDAFKDRNMCCTFGVIPYVRADVWGDAQGRGVAPLSARKASILEGAIEAGAVDAALHGYCHQATTQTWPRTEFAGLPYGEQLDKISKGKDLLEEMIGAQITTFIPPWNSYDANTVRVLEDLGFTCISAARTGEATGASSLKLLPATCDLAGLREAVESARQVADPSPIVVALFHPYDFVEANQGRGTLTFSQLERLLDWVASEHDVVTSPIGRLAGTERRLGVDRFVANKPLRRLPACVPSFVPGMLGVPVGVYLSVGASRGLEKARSRIYAATIVFYTAVALLTAVVALALERAVRRRSAFAGAVCQYAGLVLLTAALAYGLRNLRLGYRDTLVISSLAGMCIGMWLPTFGRTAGRRAARAEPTA